MKILCLFYDSTGGINIVNRLVFDAVKLWASENSAEVAEFHSNDCRTKYFDEAIERSRADVLVTQDIFPNILEAMENAKASKKLCYTVVEMYETRAKYKSIQYLDLLRGEPNAKDSTHFYMPFDIENWPIR